MSNSGPRAAIYFLSKWVFLTTECVMCVAAIILTLFNYWFASATGWKLECPTYRPNKSVCNFLFFSCPALSPCFSRWRCRVHVPVTPAGWRLQRLWFLPGVAVPPAASMTSPPGGRDVALTDTPNPHQRGLSKGRQRVLGPETFRNNHKQTAMAVGYITEAKLQPGHDLLSICQRRSPGRAPWPGRVLYLCMWQSWFNWKRCRRYGVSLWMCLLVYKKYGQVG